MGATKLHIGCGPRYFGSDWVHIDGGNYEFLDFFDIKNLSQFDSCSIDLIYASHVIEYFDRSEIVSIMKEWYRVLKINGVIRLAVPDFSTICSLYCGGGYGLDSFLGPLYGRMNMGEKIIYHKTVYDFNSLNTILLNCGFKNVHRYNWRETEHSNIDDCSQAYLPHMDKENGVLISLNVEANK
jgi:predicted SAM-dependent methyltransferase